MSTATKTPQTEIQDNANETDTDLYLSFRGCTVGKTPSGFNKFAVEMKPEQAISIVPYDPKQIEKIDPKVATIWSPELIKLKQRVQREINDDQVERIAKYIEDGTRPGGFAQFEGVCLAVRESDVNLAEATKGVVKIRLGAEPFCFDAQHRFMALLLLRRRNPEILKSFTVLVSVKIYPDDRYVELCSQALHDANAFQRPMTASEVCAADLRDPITAAAKALATKHSILLTAGGVNMKTDNLGRFAKELVAFSSLRKFTLGFHTGKRPEGGDEVVLSAEQHELLQEKLDEYVSLLGEAFPTWQKHAEWPETICRSAAAFQALGVVGHHIFEVYPNDAEARREAVACISEENLPWKRSATDIWGPIFGTTPQGKVPLGSKYKQIDDTVELLLSRVFPSGVPGPDESNEGEPEALAVEPTASDSPNVEAAPSPSTIPAPLANGAASKPAEAPKPVPSAAPPSKAKASDLKAASAKPKFASHDAE